MAGSAPRETNDVSLQVLQASEWSTSHLSEGLRASLGKLPQFETGTKGSPTGAMSLIPLIGKPLDLVNVGFGEQKFSNFSCSVVGFPTKPQQAKM